MIRRAIARHDGDNLELTDADLWFTVDLQTVEEPPVTGVATDLEPPVTVCEPFDDGDTCVVLEPDIWETVDVVPVALADAPFVIRSPSVRIDRAERRTMPLLDATCEAPAVRIEPPRVVRTRPPALQLMRRASTPPGAVSEVQLRSYLLALFKASRCTSPTALELVGIYHRVPGGAIESVAVDAGSLLIRLDPGRRGRPTTLVVGRVRASQHLVTVEISV